MGNSLDTIAVLNDASEAWRHFAERPNHYQKLDYHIAMQWEALFFT